MAERMVIDASVAAKPKTLYDMAYLSLAEELDCQWCTADEKVLASSPALFPKERVLLLSSLR